MTTHTLTPLFAVLLAALAAAQTDSPDHLASPTTVPTTLPVLHQETATGDLWAAGASWKASFTSAGCTYFPRFVVPAPRHFPLQFTLRSATVAGEEIPFAGSVAPRRTGDHIAFDRGAVRELYDLTPDHVAQTFVVDPHMAGDVVVELAIATELREDASRPGLQFVGEHGEVGYGDAFLVRGDGKLPLESTWLGDAVRITVPAALRGDGPVVIDPLVSTSSPSGGNPLRPVNRPAAAFAAGSGTWLLAWEGIPTTNDPDLYCQLFDRNGVPLAGTAAAIDITTAYAQAPSIGTLHAEDRFLLAYSVARPDPFQGRTGVFGRVRGAHAAAALSAEFAISNPQQPGHQYDPQVGGDCGTGPSPTGWLVTWAQTDVAAHTVRWRVLGPTGTGLGAEHSAPAAREVRTRPTVSASNGRGRVSRPGWLLCYQEMDANTNDHDVWAVWVDLQGTARHHFAVATGPARDVVPSVSSPTPTPDGTRTRFVVTHKHGPSLSARATQVTLATTASAPPTVASAFDLTAAFGFTSGNLAVETDGVRFALLAGVPGTPQSGLATLVFDGNGAAVVHDPIFPVSGDATWGRLTSEHAGGGGATNFAAVYGDRNPTSGYSSWILFTLYRAHQPGPQVAYHVRGCDGVQTQWSGQPLLGQTMQFTLGNLGGSLAGFAVGEPDLFGAELCPSCTIGLRLDRPLSTVFGNPTLALAIPPLPALVGQTYGVQGLRIGGGLCLGGISLGDLVTITIR